MIINDKTIINMFNSDDSNFCNLTLFTYPKWSQLALCTLLFNALPWSVLQ